MVAVFKTITPTLTVGKKCPHNICAMSDTSIKKKDQRHLQTQNTRCP